MKHLIITCCFSLLLSIPLTGQTQPTVKALEDNQGLKYHLDLFTKLEGKLKSLDLATNDFTNTLNDLLQKELTTNYPTTAIETQVVHHQLGPEAFLSRQEAQAVWNDAVSPFNPENALIGNNVGGVDMFNNMPVLIIRPKIGAFLNEKLLLDWD